MKTKAMTVKALETRERNSYNRGGNDAKDRVLAHLKREMKKSFDKNTLDGATVLEWVKHLPVRWQRRKGGL